jgi:predicted small lipoprotein YifL
MSRYPVVRLAFAAGALAGMVLLAGCGKQGPLEQPRPLFGARAKAEYDAQKAQEARDEAQRAAQRPASSNQQAPDNTPATTRDLRDPNQRLAPASSAPIAGAPNPGGAPVQARPQF